LSQQPIRQLLHKKKMILDIIDKNLLSYMIKKQINMERFNGKKQSNKPKRDNKQCI